MQQLLAVINLTYKECVRKKVFWIIIFFTVLLTSSSLLLPVITPADRLRLIEVWSLRSISLFGMLMAIFLVAVSIPEDIEDHKFYSILTKPISRSTYIMGKLLGYVVVMAVFTALMGLLSLGYLKVVNALIKVAPGKVAPLVRLNQKIKAKEFSFKQPDHNRGGVASGKYSVDKEKSLEVFLSGEIANRATWRFEDLKSAQLSDPVKAELKVGISEPGFRFASRIFVGAKVYDPESKKQLLVLLENTEVRHHTPIIIKFNRKYIDRFGDLELFVERTNPASQIIVTPDSLQILSGPKNYTWNYMKVVGMIFFKIVLLIVLVIMGSTFLSTGITILFGIFMLFCGGLMGFFKESVQAMERAIRYVAPLEAAQRVGHHAHADEGLPIWMMKASDFILHYAFKVLPDFSIFSGSEYLKQDLVIPASAISNALSYLGLFALIGVIIAWLCFRMRELE